MQLSTKVLLLLALIFIIGLAIVFWGNDTVLAAKRLMAATPDAQGELTIVAKDYEFVPDVVRVKAGQQIELTIRNEGLHTHEFMVGKQVHLENGVTEPPTPDFFEGLQVEVTGGGMPMGFAGMEEMDMGGMDMSEGDAGMDMGSEEHTDGDEHADTEDEHADGEMDMQQEGEADHMEEGDDEHDDQMGEEMAMDEEEHADGDEHADDEMAMDMSGDEGMDMVMGEGAKVVIEGAHTEPMEMGHGDHHGGMVMVDPAQESTIIMTIPEDKAGIWTFGCFQEEGLHFDDGMHGTFIVER